MTRPSHALLVELSSLADPARRGAAARELAATMRCDDVLFFVRDAQLDALLPALGFPKTLPDGRAWRAFVAQAVQDAGERDDAVTAGELVSPRTQQRAHARAIARDGVVAVLLGGGEGALPADTVRELRASLPLLGALFRTEHAMVAGAGNEAVARREALRAESLAATLAASQNELHAVLWQLQQSKEWFATTLRSIGDAVITTDAEGRVTFMNPVAETTTGWRLDEARAATVGSVFRVIDEATRGPIASPVDAVLRDGVTVGLANGALLVKRDGSEVAIDDSAAPIRDAAGALTGVVLVFRDVTERRRAERARAKLVDELRGVLRANELFAGILGHDLRNPLGSILLSAEMLTRAEDAKARRSAERIVRSGQRMHRMIDQLLDFTRLRAGAGLNVVRSIVDAAELCDLVVGEIAVANPTWRLRVERQGDVRGAWDSDRLAQVLSNLVGNAVRHGEIERGVTVRLDGQAPGELTIEVHNGGVIPADVLPGLFDPYRRGRDAGTHQPADGLGLGLFITREIVTAHGGSVEARSDERDGTVFRVRLPRFA